MLVTEVSGCGMRVKSGSGNQVFWGWGVCVVALRRYSPPLIC